MRFIINLMHLTNENKADHYPRNISKEVLAVVGTYYQKQIEVSFARVIVDYCQLDGIGLYMYILLLAFFL